MSLDFYITQFYRLIVNDIILLSDVYHIYYQLHKKSDKSPSLTYHRFNDLVLNVIEVEASNFEDIDTNKLTHIYEDQNISIMLVIFDYFNDVIIKHLLDDYSQYPFWLNKIICTTNVTTEHFGLPIMHSYINSFKNIYNTQGLIGYYIGSVPYVVASMICNYKYLFKSTDIFLRNIRYNHLYCDCYDL